MASDHVCKIKDKEINTTSFSYPDDLSHPDFPKTFYPPLTHKMYCQFFREGDWIQTEDGIVCEIVRSSVSMFEIPEGGQYRKCLVKDGSVPVLFNPPEGHKLRQLEHDGGKLTRQQHIFCWEMAKTWNPEQALTKAGYSVVSQDQIKASFYRLYKLKKVRAGIMQAIRVHLKAAHIEEENFVVAKMNKLGESLLELEAALSAHIKDDVAVNGKIDESAIKSYAVIVGELKDALAAGKELLYPDGKSSPQALADGNTFMFNVGPNPQQASIQAGNGISLPQTISSSDENAEEAQVSEPQIKTTFDKLLEEK